MFPAKVILLLVAPFPPSDNSVCITGLPSVCSLIPSHSSPASPFSCILPKSRSAATHYFTLAYQLGTEFGTIQCQVDIKVHTVECALGCVHALKVLLKVLAGEIGCQCNDFLDTYIAHTVSSSVLRPLSGQFDDEWGKTYEGLWYTRGRHRRRTQKGYPHT